MDPGTASARLLRDQLWAFVKASKPACYRCGLLMTRETFSLDHKRPWLDSEDPVGLFFESTNIAYSHLACNYGDARRPHQKTDAELAAMPASRRNRILRDRARGGGHLRKKK